MGGDGSKGRGGQSEGWAKVEKRWRVEGGGGGGYERKGKRQKTQ